MNMKILLLEDFSGDKEHYIIKSEKGLTSFIKEHIDDEDDVAFIINILLTKGTYNPTYYNISGFGGYDYISLINISGCYE